MWVVYTHGRLCNTIVVAGKQTWATVGVCWARLSKRFNNQTIISIGFNIDITWFYTNKNTHTYWYNETHSLQWFKKYLSGHMFFRATLYIMIHCFVTRHVCSCCRHVSWPHRNQSVCSLHTNLITQNTNCILTPQSTISFSWQVLSFR